jgi:hypothetical protein
MPMDCDAHATLLRHAIARFVEVRIDGLVHSAASGSYVLTWALRHLVEEIRTGPPHTDPAPLAALWPDDEDEETDTPDRRATREDAPARTTPRNTHHSPRRTVMLTQDHPPRTGPIVRHGHSTHGRLPTWQRQHVPVHGARTGPRDTSALDGHRVRHGRRGGR